MSSNTTCPGENEEESAVNRWLNSIRLDIYKETFRKHLYTDMERVRRIWEVELTAVLEIHRVGHRKRILASVSGQQAHGSHGPNFEDINADLSLLVSSHLTPCNRILLENLIVAHLVNRFLASPFMEPKVLLL
jgi:hypothetical protein